MAHDVSARSGPSLLCVGDIDMDIIVKVPCPPGRDRKVDGTRVAVTPGGMAANVAVGARRLGTPARMVAAVGDDAMGRDALDALKREGLDLAHVATRHGTATFFCIIMVDDEGEKSLVKAVSPAYLPQPSDLTQAAFEGIGHVHMTFTEPDLAIKTLTMAREANATVSLDLEAADVRPDGGIVAHLVTAVDILFLSEQSRTEVERRTGPLASAGDRTIVTTRGSSGARLERGGRVLEAQGHRVRVTDTSGAGDAFAAAFLHFHLAGLDDETALHFANAAAALSTRAYGAQAGLPTKSEVDTFLKQRTRERTDA